MNDDGTDPTMDAGPETLRRLLDAERMNRNNLVMQRDAALAQVVKLKKLLDERERVNDTLIDSFVRRFHSERQSVLDAIDVLVSIDGGFRDRIGTEDELDDDLAMLRYHERMVGYAMGLKRAKDEVAF